MVRLSGKRELRGRTGQGAAGLACLGNDHFERRRLIAVDPRRAPA